MDHPSCGHATMVITIPKAQRGTLSFRAHDLMTDLIELFRFLETMLCSCEIPKCCCVSLARRARGRRIPGIPGGLPSSSKSAVASGFATADHWGIRWRQNMSKRDCSAQHSPRTTAAASHSCVRAAGKIQGEAMCNPRTRRASLSRSAMKVERSPCVRADRKAASN